MIIQQPLTGVHKNKKKEGQGRMRAMDTDNWSSYFTSRERTRMNTRDSLLCCSAIVALFLTVNMIAFHFPLFISAQPRLHRLSTSSLSIPTQIIQKEPPNERKYGNHRQVPTEDEIGPT